ncbi:hypothetical protein HPY42_02230 [Coprothermobacteraceae bacterium]|nr:hypothetical protein [Coprothermobacteraceae bacterium]
MHKLWRAAITLTVCGFLLCSLLVDYWPRNSWAVKLASLPLFTPPAAQQHTRLLFTESISNEAIQESDLESRMTVPLLWRREQTILNILTGTHPGLNNFRTMQNTPYQFALEHLDGYATFKNVPPALSFLERLQPGDQLEVLFVEKVSHLEPGDIAVEVNTGLVKVYGMVVFKDQLPAKSTVRMSVYDIMPLVSNLAGIPYPPASVGAVPWEALPLTAELRAYRGFFEMRQKLVLADGIATALLGTSRVRDTDSYDVGVSYFLGRFDEVIKQEESLRERALSQIHNVSTKKWLLDLSQRWPWLVLGAAFLAWGFDVRMVLPTLGLMLLSALVGGFLFRFNPLFLIAPALGAVVAHLLPQLDAERIFGMTAGIVFTWLGLFGARRYIIQIGTLNAYLLWSAYAVALVSGLYLIFKRTWEEIHELESRD